MPSPNGADKPADPKRQPTADDFQAAEKVIPRLKSPPAPDSPEYQALRGKLADHRATIGGDRFDLYYELRPPRNAFEKGELDFANGRITEEQWREMVKADAERPIDAEMLNAFCDAYEQRLIAYSRVLQTITASATDQHQPASWQQRETEVDRDVEEMEAKLPLWKEQVGTVFTFLAEVRADRAGEPVRCGQYTAESAYMLARRVTHQTVELWRSCRKIAGRSRTDPQYLYATTASALFYKTHLPSLPKPNDLQSLMVLERASALKALKRRDTGQTATVNIQAAAVNVNAPAVHVAGGKPEESETPNPKKHKRLSRKAAEPLIRQHLLRRPNDTAEEVAKAVGCSKGLVAESLAWKENRAAAQKDKRGRTPKAVELHEEVINADGGHSRRQSHAFRDAQDEVDEAIDREERALDMRIGAYLIEHPKASVQDIARAVGCTAGAVERRQAVLDRLIAQQVKSQAEEGGESAGKGKRQKWVRKEV
jgi:hypothetical protein